MNETALIERYLSGAHGNDPDLGHHMPLGKISDLHSVSFSIPHLQQADRMLQARTTWSPIFVVSSPDLESAGWS